MDHLVDENGAVNDSKVADLICVEPLLYKGLTTTELTSLAIGGFLVWAVGGMLVIILSGGSLFMMFSAFPIGLIMTIGTIVLGARVIQKYKRGKPDGYYEQKIHIKLKKTGLGRSHLIVSDQKWSV